MKKAEDFDLVTIGEAMVLFRESAAVEFAQGKQFSTSSGGAEANVAIGLTRLGHRALWISALGADIFGDLVVRNLQGEGVYLSVLRDASAFTGHMIKFSGQSDDPEVVYSRKGSAASQFGLPQLEINGLPQSRIFHLSGVFSAISEAALELSLALMSFARESGALVSFDINYRPSLWGGRDAAKTLSQLVAGADIVFGGESEFAVLSGVEAYDDEIIESMDPEKQYVIKRGSKGASSFIANQWLDIAAHRVKVVDTVGAGDAFVAGYLASVIDGNTAEKCLAAANFCGSAACESPGDWEGLVTSEQLASARLLEAETRK